MCNSVVVQWQSSYFIHKLILQIMNKQENLSSKSSFDSLPQNSVTQIKSFYCLVFMKEKVGIFWSLCKKLLWIL